MLLCAFGCQKGFENNSRTEFITPDVEESSEIVLVAQVPQSKTILQDGFKLIWDSSDQLAVFNAPAGTEVYSSNLHFRIADATTGRFTPAEGVEVPFEDGVNYDWFVCCPWRSTSGSAELVSPKGQSADDGYFPIGAQNQNGYNSSTHISSQDIMVGKVSNTRTPQVTLKHLAVLHKFTVTNASKLSTTIQKLTLNGGENVLFGTFWIDMTSDDPALDIEKANKTFNERALTIKNPTSIKSGDCVDLYMMTAPFTLNAGETLTITIETSTGTQVLEKTATSDIVFAAGTYNTANLTYDYMPDCLYYDTFYDSTSTLQSNTTFNEGSVATRWKSYLADLSGLSVYDGVKKDISYTWTWCQPSAQVAATALVGMDGLHLWFNADASDASLIVSGIKLHDYIDLNLSFVQTYKGSGLRIDYMVDNSESWQTIGETLLENRAYEYNADFDFTVPENSKTIALRFTKTATSPRIDNIKLTWQAEE